LIAHYDQVAAALLARPQLKNCLNAIREAAMSVVEKTPHALAIYGVFIENDFTFLYRLL
jgi:hypothetical protein